jgi:diadenosine tetraphosphate (Ap4A) HIT family hydrolase
MVLRDGYPVSPGHTLIVPGRHFASFFEATQAEQEALLEGLREARALLARMHHADGFNVGLNDGLAAGQTVMHCHLHIIPRYTGDHPDPRGGVRWVLPAKARYWAD